MSWLADNHSFVYLKLQKLPPGAPVTEVEQKVRSYLHVLRTDAEGDAPVFGYDVVPSISVDPRYFAVVTAPADLAYALGQSTAGCHRNSAFYIEPAAELGRTNSEWRKVADFSDDVQDVAVHGDDLYVLTYKNALSYKFVRTDAHNPDLASAETVIPMSEAVVTAIHDARDALYVELLDGGIGRVLRVQYGPHPHVEEVALPFKGTAYVGTDVRLPGALLYLTARTKAFKIYAYDPQTSPVTDTKLQPIGQFDDPPDLELVEVKVPSHDGDPRTAFDYLSERFET